MSKPPEFPTLSEKDREQIIAAVKYLRGLSAQSTDGPEGKVQADLPNMQETSKEDPLTPAGKNTPKNTR